MLNTIPLNFDNEKSHIIRGVAVVVLICTHMNVIFTGWNLGVTLFTFLVGYGYKFCKINKFIYACRRTWHLLTHYWVVLFGVCLPTAMFAGHYLPSPCTLALNMFGFSYELCMFTWYVYFYPCALLIMIPASMAIQRFGFKGWLMLCIITSCVVILLRTPLLSGTDYSDEIYRCVRILPVLFSGYYCAAVVTKYLRYIDKWWCAVLTIAVCVSLILFRTLPMAKSLDFVTIPCIVYSIVIFFNILKTQWIQTLFIKLGKQSMNMWFLHSLFICATTKVLFYPIIGWSDLPALSVFIVLIITYFMGFGCDKAYESLEQLIFRLKSLSVNKIREKVNNQRM